MVAMKTLITCEGFSIITVTKSYRFIEFSCANLTGPVTHINTSTPQDYHTSKTMSESDRFLILGIMSVSLKVLLFSSLLIIIFERLSLGRIQDRRTAFFFGIFDTFDIILNVSFKECQGCGSSRQNLRNTREEQQ